MAESSPGVTMANKLDLEELNAFADHAMEFARPTAR
jgi:hypothetical protein